MALIMKPEQPILAFATPNAFRRWLRVHHADHPGLWMRLAKKGSGLRSSTCAEALDEAPGFVWIDGQRRRCDRHTFLQKFTRRGRRSGWSKVSTGHVERLIRTRHMQAPGLAAVNAARSFCNP